MNKQKFIIEIVKELELTQSKKQKLVIEHIINNTRADNLFIAKQHDVKKELDVCIQTVSSAILAMQEAGYLKRLSSSVYEIQTKKLKEGISV